jgi:ankyrin repeat protein
MRLRITAILFFALLLLTACAPAATALPPTSTPLPTATVPPTVTAVPTATLSPEELQEAMFEATRNDDTAAVERYIAAGAAVNEEGPQGVTVLVVASVRGNVELVELLLETGAEFDETDFAAVIANSKGNVQLVQSFLDHGADVNLAPDTSPGHTPLMEAAETGDIEVGKLLLANGAEINMGDAFGDPAVNVAAFNGQLEFTKMLIEMGADPNIRGYGNRTAVGQALSRGHDEIADYLLSVGGTE